MTAKKKAQPKAAATEKKPAKGKAAANANAAYEKSDFDAIEIALDCLEPWPGNPRKTGVDEDLPALKASILSHGLLQSLVVSRKGNTDRYQVVSGGRRLSALKELAREKKIPENQLILCQLTQDADNLAEIALAENVVRSQMHPADQFIAFKELADKGYSLAEIGARFGVTETVVKKRLTLGYVSPKVIKEYRDGKMDLDQIQAFAVTTDHKAQERLLKEGDRDGDGNFDERAHYIRRMLTEETIRGTDKRVRFVGAEAFEAAGGTVRRDLFAEESDDDVYFEDPALLDRLVREKLQQCESTIKAEGWGWVSASIEEPSHAELGKYSTLTHKKSQLSATDKKTLADLQKLVNALSQKESEDYLTAAEERQMAEAAFAISEIQEKAKSWPEKAKPNAGVIIGISSDGTLEIHRGLVLKKEAKKAEAKTAAKKKTPTEIKREKEAIEAGEDNTVSAKLLESFTAHRSFGIGAALAKNIHVGFAAAVHALTLDIFYDAGDGESCLTMSAREVHLPGTVEDNTCKGYAELQRQKGLWMDKIPEDEVKYLDWCLAQSDTTLAELMAFVAGLAVNDINNSGRRDENAEKLWRVLGVDMADWFTPTVDNTFSHLPKPQLQQIITDHGGAFNGSEKKTQLAEMAAAAVEGKRYLPIPMRLPAGKDPATDKEE